MSFIEQGKTNWKYVIIVVILGLSVGAGILWQQKFILEETFNKEEIIKNLTIESVENAEYYFISYNQWVKLADGKYDSLDSHIFTRIIDDKIALGDLNGDGKKEAAVIVSINGGGSGSFRELAIMKNENGIPVYSTSTILGDRVTVNSLTIDSGIIIIDMVVHGPNDPMCCPTLNEVVRYKLSDGQLIEITEDETANWKIYKNEEYGFEFKIAPSFEEFGYEIKKSTSPCWELKNQLCDVVSFNANPAKPYICKGDDSYKTMFSLFICSQEYCQDNDTKDICQAIREDRQEVPERDITFMFTGFVAENNKFLFFKQGGPGSGDPLDCMGWDVGQDLKRMNSTFKLIDFYTNISLEWANSVPQLIGINQNGEEKIILEDINEILPISKYGQEKNRIKAEYNVRAMPSVYSFIKNDQKIYIERIEGGTEIIDYLYEYNLQSKEVRKIDILSKYIFGYNAFHKLSPDGNMVAVYGDDGVGIFDLMKNSEIISISPQNIDGILAFDRKTIPAENGSEYLFKWNSSDVLQYPTYREADEQYTYQLKKIETINLENK
jgi:hypothetical protein